MPRKDPVTGVMVMTTGEFFAKEAEREGKGRSGGELMSEMFADMEKSRQETEAEYRNPEFALKTLIEAIKNENSYLTENHADDIANGTVQLIDEPVRVTEVFDVEYKENFGGRSLLLSVVAERKDGTSGVLELREWYSRGSFYEPPDGETDVWWDER